MFIDINEIERGEGISFERDLDLAGVTGAPADALRVKRARISGTIEREDVGWTLDGFLDATVQLDCSRCAEPFDVVLEFRFGLTLVLDAVEFAADSSRIEDDDASLFYTREGKADLVQIATEQIYLNLPLKPICREGCKGLCPRCGTNRNLTDCGCAVETVDPRLAPLLQFKKRR